MSTHVLVVDDTALFRRIITDALTAVPGVEVAGTAPNGKMALARLASLRPDLMTLDIEMPEMDGIAVLEAMRSAGITTGVIVLSARTVRGGEMTMRALELGAFDFLPKPDEGSSAANLAWLREHLQPMIRAFERRSEIRSILRGNSPPVPEPILPAAPRTPAPLERRRLAGPPLVLIAVSTGGPEALARVLPALPADLGAPVFIVQHMPAFFTQALAAALAAKSAVRVKEAADGETAVANCIYIAPGGKQMKLAPGAQGEIVVRITDDPPENHCKPAADYLFRSAALNFPGRAVAAVMTGMGNDGTAGLRMLKRSGCLAIAQDEASCVVFGMPREAIAAGLVDAIVPLETIAPTIVRSLREART
jgi:two-component system, chemotaxis family, protein-glutamate methylesterase/glutaminase